jgi:hypothetical protein
MAVFCPAHTLGWEGNRGNRRAGAAPSAHRVRSADGRGALGAPAVSRTGTGVPRASRIAGLATVTKLIATVVLGAASLGLVAACGGGGGSGEAQGKLGGRPVTTDGQRVRVIKMLGDVTEPSALSVETEVCGKNTTAGRFFVEVNRRRTVSPLGSPETLDLTPDCFSAWNRYVLPTGNEPTAIIYARDALRPWENKVRFSVPKAAPLPSSSLPTTTTTTTTPTTTAPPPPPPPTNPPTMSLAEFNAIQNGWTLQQVIDTVGGPGQLQSTSDFDGQHLEGYTWPGQSSLGYASGGVFFRNGLVYDKIQFNLQ